jgi:hypothetical protein
MASALRARRNGRRFPKNQRIKERINVSFFVFPKAGPHWAGLPLGSAAKDGGVSEKYEQDARDGF